MWSPRLRLPPALFMWSPRLRLPPALFLWSPRLRLPPALFMWSPRLRLRLPLHYGPDDPGGELLFADAGELALGTLAGGDRDDLLENLPPDVRERRALEDDAAVDVHVLLHV